MAIALILEGVGQYFFFLYMFGGQGSPSWCPVTPNHEYLDLKFNMATSIFFIYVLGVQGSIVSANEMTDKIAANIL